MPLNIITNDKSEHFRVDIKELDERVKKLEEKVDKVVDIILTMIDLHKIAKAKESENRQIAIVGSIIITGFAFGALLVKIINLKK